MTDPSLARTRSSSELDELVLSSDRASSPECFTSSSDMREGERSERRMRVYELWLNRMTTEVRGRTLSLADDRTVPPSFTFFFPSLERE
jgi:hypothetical protein